MTSLSKTRWPFILGLPLLLTLFAASSRAGTNDKALETLMRNLRDNARSFRQPFTSALEKSTIGKTRQAKNAENLASLFEKQTEALLDDHKQTKRAGNSLGAVQDTSRQLDEIVRHDLRNSPASPRWEKIQAELQQIVEAYGPDQLKLDQHNNPAGRAQGITPRSVPLPNTAGSCGQAVGKARAERLVQECLQVSPATHPPCNAQNSCSLIIGEIKRSCALLGHQAPAFCREYR